MFLVKNKIKKMNQFKTEMDVCNICFDEDISVITHCCNQKICKYCLIRINKCIICKKDVFIPKFYFAGKIINNYKKIRPSKINNYFFKDLVKKLDLKTRIPIIVNNDYKFSKRYDLTKSEYGNLDKYLELEFVFRDDKIKYNLKKDYIITGPFYFLNEDNFLSMGHGFINSYNLLIDEKTKFKINKQIINLNDSGIRNCNVFSLKVNNQINMFTSLSQWGYAKKEKKILIIYFDTDFNNSKFENKNKKEFSTFIIESLESFDDLSFKNKNKIIENHPELKFVKFNEYKISQFVQYKNYLRDILK